MDLVELLRHWGWVALSEQKICWAETWTWDLMITWWDIKPSELQIRGRVQKLSVLAAPTPTPLIYICKINIWVLIFLFLCRSWDICVLVFPLQSHATKGAAWRFLFQMLVRIWFWSWWWLWSFHFCVDGFLYAPDEQARCRCKQPQAAGSGTHERVRALPPQ